MSCFFSKSPQQRSRARPTLPKLPPPSSLPSLTSWRSTTQGARAEVVRTRCRRLPVGARAGAGSARERLKQAGGGAWYGRAVQPTTAACPCQVQNCLFGTGAHGLHTHSALPQQTLSNSTPHTGLRSGCCRRPPAGPPHVLQLLLYEAPPDVAGRCQLQSLPQHSRRLLLPPQPRQRLALPQQHTAARRGIAACRARRAAQVGLEFTNLDPREWGSMAGNAVPCQLPRLHCATRPLPMLMAVPLLESRHTRPATHSLTHSPGARASACAQCCRHSSQRCRPSRQLARSRWQALAARRCAAGSSPGASSPADRQCAQGCHSAAVLRPSDWYGAADAPKCALKWTFTSAPGSCTRAGSGQHPPRCSSARSNLEQAAARSPLIASALPRSLNTRALCMVPLQGGRPRSVGRTPLRLPGAWQMSCYEDAAEKTAAWLYWTCGK